MDIREFNKIPNEEIPPELFDLDILDGSPPCTTFSMAGDREESWGKKKKFREGQAEQTLDDLSFVFIETVAKLRPRVVIMENVEGLLLGEAWAYVQEIYKQFKGAGYRTKHWLCKGENMGIPQMRHRVFFVSIREDVDFDLDHLDMSFNYEPVLYGEIKTGEGEKLRPETVINQWLQRVEPGDMNIGDTIVRCGEKEKLFSHKLCWPDRIMPTIASAGEMLRGEEKTRISTMDIIHGQTFPENFNFVDEKFKNIKYICGMSVPPVMIKRIVQRLIEAGVFSYKLGGANG